MRHERLASFLDALRAHDRAPALAFAGLLQRADDDGLLDRGEWLAAFTQSVDPAVAEALVAPGCADVDGRLDQPVGDLVRGELPVAVL